MGGSKLIMLQMGESGGVQPAMGDDVSGFLVAIDEIHREIHEGNAYLLTYVQTPGDGGQIDVLITTPNSDDEAHMVIIVDALGDTYVKLYEDVEMIDYPANRLTAYNRNRNSDNEATVLVCHTPGGNIGDGVLIGSAAFGIDTGLGASRIIGGGKTSSREEIVLKKNTQYLLRIDSGTASNRMTIALDWYEHEPTYTQ